MTKRKVHMGKILYGLTAIITTVAGMSITAYHILLTSSWSASLLAGAGAFLAGVVFTSVFIGIAAAFSAWRRKVRARHIWSNDED